MKKTLERLKKEAFKDTGYYAKQMRELWKNSGEMNSEIRALLNSCSNCSYDAITSLLRYIQALEDYGYELDEQWDELLKSVEPTQEDQPKSVKKKDKTEKTDYIK